MKQAIAYRMSYELKTTYAGEDGILLLRNGKFVVWKLKSSRLSLREADRPYRSTGVIKIEISTKMYTPFLIGLN